MQCSWQGVFSRQERGYMRAKILLGIMMTMLLSVLALTQATNPRAGPRSKAETAQPVAAVDQQEVEALRADIKRMRVLLNQMQVNLAFVQTSDTPLKHEFDLNNEMWQILLGDMERRVEKMEQGKH